MCVMNISLTWANYALIAGACLAGYYIVIGFVYYRKDLLQRLRPKREPVSYPHKQAVVGNSYQSNLSSNTSGSDDTGSVEGKQQDTQPTIEDFMDEVYAFTETCGNNITKEDLGVSLRNILQKYPSLTGSSLRNVLAGVIATASETNCSIQWREDELNELWNGSVEQSTLYVVKCSKIKCVWRAKSPCKGHLFVFLSLIER